jgi:arogenate dehydrogenase (NADP+)
MTALWRRRPVGIVGLGLIGGSLGLDLRAAGAEVHALVHRQATAERAQARGLADRISTDPAVLADCGLVVLALPIDRLLQPEPALVAALPAQAVVTDVGSVKQPVLRLWGGLLGPRFVASHPMAGTAQAGVEAGELGLFAGRAWVATPAHDTSAIALEAVHDLAVELGARWLLCDAAEHDRVVALISHLPVLLGAALLQSAASGGDLARLLASSGFADTSRVGAGNPELGSLMAQGNREALLDALAVYRKALQRLEEHVQQSDWSALRQDLERSQKLRPEFL